MSTGDSSLLALGGRGGVAWLPGTLPKVQVSAFCDANTHLEKWTRTLGDSLMPRQGSGSENLGCAPLEKTKPEQEPLSALVTGRQALLPQLPSDLNP